MPFVSEWWNSDRSYAQGLYLALGKYFLANCFKITACFCTTKRFSVERMAVRGWDGVASGMLAGKTQMQQSKRRTRGLWNVCSGFEQCFQMCLNKGKDNSSCSIVAPVCKYFFCVCLSHANPSYQWYWCVASRIKDGPELVGKNWFPGDTTLSTCIAVKGSGLGCGWGWGQAPASVLVW